MVKLFGRGKEEEFMRKQQIHEMGIAHIQASTQGRAQARAMGIPDPQRLNDLNRGYFLSCDQQVINQIIQEKPELLPVISSLNATSKIVKEKDRRIVELHLDDMILHEEMNLDDPEDSVTLQYLKALRYFGQFRIFDAMDGYRGKLVTEEIERTTVQIEQPKKKGIL